MRCRWFVWWYLLCWIVYSAGRNVYISVSCRIRMRCSWLELEFNFLLTAQGDRSRCRYLHFWQNDQDRLNATVLVSNQFSHQVNHPVYVCVFSCCRKRNIFLSLSCCWWCVTLSCCLCCRLLRTLPPQMLLLCRRALIPPGAPVLPWISWVWLPAHQMASLPLTMGESTWSSRKPNRPTFCVSCDVMGCVRKSWRNASLRRILATLCRWVCVCLCFYVCVYVCVFWITSSVRCESWSRTFFGMVNHCLCIISWPYAQKRN